MTTRDVVLDRLGTLYPELSPQLRVAAKYVLDAPAEVAINSMRGIAASARVGPSTMLRLARRLGFPTYEDFRRPFQEATRSSHGSFADRAAWLRSLAGEAREGDVLTSMAEAAISNIESSFGMIESESLARAADIIRKARTAYVFSGGGLIPIARYFHAVTRMILPSCRFVDGVAGFDADLLMHAGPDDAMLVISCAPYADSTVRGARLAHGRGVKVVAFTDSRASPLAQAAEEVILAPTQSPQFFPSQTAMVALLETLIASIVARSDKEMIGKIDEIERLRHREGFYWRGRARPG